MAELLADLSLTIMGYDVINEPILGRMGTINGYFDERSLVCADELNQFYLDVMKSDYTINKWL